MSNLPSRFRPILPASLALLFFASIMTLLSLTPDLAQAAVNCSDSSWAVGDEADLNAAIACFNGKNTFGVHTISLTQNIDLTSSTTAIGNTSEDISFVLDGNGYILNGQQITGVRPLDIVTGTIATVQYLTVTGGSLIGTGPTDGGAGIRSFGQLTLETSTVVSNTSGSNGGGIAQYGDAGNLQVTESTVAYNSAAGNGGGIYHHSSNGTVSRSTLHHNSSGGNGGGLFTDKANSSVSVSNSTISGNSAPSGSGGGIYNNDANLTVNSATVYTNSASTTGGIFGFYTNPTGGDTGLKNSIFAGNAGGDCGGTVVNNGNNIVQDGSCNGLGDQNDPMLAPLADNGGPTLTHAPMVGSLAIDEGATGLAMDQRGQARPIGVADDIGAFEFLPNHPVMVTSNNGTITSNPAGIDCGSTCSTDFLQGTVVSLTVMADSGYVFSGWSGDDSSSDNPLVFTVSSEKVVTANYIDCSGGPNWTVGSEAELSSAIACFNGETSAGQYTISLTNDVLLSTSTPAIDNGTAGVELLIAGNGYAVDGQNISGVRVFEINADTDVEMTQIIVKNGYLFSGLGAGILLNADGRLTVKNSQIVSNTTSFSDFGAGISAGDNTTLEVIDSQLEGNNGRSGGLSSSGQVIIQNSAFVDNVGLYGGAIVAGTGGTMTVTNSTFSGNSANFGGAILTIGASANIDTSTFMTNTSAQGVLRVLSGSINMDNSIMADSSANNCGTAVLTGSNNLIDDESCGVSAGDVGDPTNVDPTLADNGGPTLTHALLAGSNAIDAAGDTGYDTDQRGVTRTLGSADDIGAFEYTPPMTLTMVTAGNGAGDVTSLPSGISCGATCAHPFTYNSVVTLTAAPATGSAFTGWSGDLMGSANPLTLTLDGSKTVTATFDLAQFELAVATDGNGSGTITSQPSGIDCGSTCTESFDYGSVVTLTAAADNGSTFTGWSGSCSGTADCVVTVNSAVSATVTFALEEYALTVSTDGSGSGSVTQSPDAQSYPFGTVVTLAATADNGSTFTGWSGAVSGSSSPITVTIDGPKSITATFTLGSNVLSMVNQGTGSGLVTSNPAGIDCGSTCGFNFDFDTLVTLTATADADSTFTGWEGACTGSAACVVTMNEAKSVTANFTLNSYGLTITTDGTGSGSITKSPDLQSYPHGTVVTLTATADSGSTFTGWTGDASGTDNPLVLTMSAAKSVGATFTADVVEQQSCTGQALKDLINSGNSTVELDGDCRYALTDQTGSLGHVFDLRNKAGFTINGNGATIALDETAGELGIFFFVFGNNITMRDVTLEGGRAISGQDIDWGQRGGAILLYETTGFVLENVKFLNNQSKEGGALTLRNSSEATLRNVTFENNTALDDGVNTARGGAMAVSFSSRTTIENSHFTGNTGNSGGAFALMSDSVGTLRQVTFENNVAHSDSTDRDRGGAMLVAWGSSTTIEDSRFINNRGDFGGAISVLSADATIDVVNSVFAKNIANDAGAAVFNNGIGSAIKHSTITADPPNNRQAVYVWGEMEVHNTIITNHDIALAVSGKLNADHNLFQGNANDVYPYRDSIFTGGDNSITAADVRFVDAANDDFRIQANSPAIDRGSASTTTADANGNARPYLQTGVDIGAYEYQGEGIAAIALTKQGPPWFNSFEQVSYDLILENSGIFTATNLVITESLPAGTVYVPDSITNGGTYADRVVTWTVETLAPGEDLRFEYTITGTVDIVSNNYAVVSQDNPAVQATGETITTSINASLVANWNFYPNPQGYSFPNYSDSPDSDLTAEDMVFIFGEVVCKTTNPCVLTATAEQWRKDRIEGVKGGHCAGMAMSSLQLFQDPLVNPINYQSGADMTHDLTKPNIRKLIGLYAMTQFSLPIDQTGLADVAYRHDGTINVLNQLIENLDDPDANDRYQLNFYLPDMTAGHAVVPFAVEEKEDNEYWVYVYDNNYPNANDRVFKVNRATGDWIYEGAATVPGAPASDWQGTGDGENQLLLISTAWTTKFPKICTTACTPDESRSPFDTNPLDIQLDGEAYILITRNEDGKRFGSDLTTGALIDEIDGAERILNTNGMGLKLPGTMRIPHTAGSTYTIEIANRDTAFGNTAAPVNLSIFGLGKAFRLTDLDLNDPNSGQIIVDQAGPTRASMANAEQDKVNISFKPDSNEIAFKTSAIDADTPDIAMAINNPAGEDFTFELSNISVAADSTVSMAFDESVKELSFGDDDTTTDPTYNLDTTRTNPDGSSDTISQEDVTDGQGSGGSISFENWDGESTPEVEEIADVFTIHLPMVNR